MTSEYQWTPKNTLDHATTIAIVTAPMAIPRRTEGDRPRANTMAIAAYAAAAAAECPLGNELPIGMTSCESVGRGRSTTPFTALFSTISPAIVTTTNTIGHGLRVRTNMNRPTAIPTTHTVRLAPRWVRTWKTKPSPPRLATHVAIGRSRPIGRWPKATIPRTTTAATQAAAPTTTALGTRALIAGCLPFTKKEKPPPMRTDDTAHRLGKRFQDHHPATVAVGIAVTGALLLTLIVVGIGLSLTEGLLSGPLGRWDERVNDWFLAHRTAGLDPWAHLGSTIAMTGSVLAVAAVVVIVLLIARRWSDAAFLVTALAIEVSVFLITTVLVARPRPTVPQLQPAPPTSSFPSGHTAAAIALYVGLAMLLSPHVRSTGLKVLIWAVAISVPVFVAVSRVYAGMHHVTDVLASVIVGAGALMVASLAIRTAIVIRDEHAVRNDATDDRVLVTGEVAR